MNFEPVIIQMRREQKVEFEGCEVARSRDSSYVVYETPKGHWVVVKKEFTKKPTTTRNSNNEYILSGLDESYEVIKDKNHKALFECIGYNKHLDEICSLLNISPTKKLDL